MHLSIRTSARIAALLLAMLCNGASADVDAGIASYQRGDFVAAFAEFSAAAKTDNPLAMSILGIMYAEGRGVGRNDKLAVDWFLKAKALGSHEALANLGRMYAEGRGVPQSNAEALKHYRDAALGGYLPAVKRLAEIYATGELGVTPDPEMALGLRARLRDASTALATSSPAPAAPTRPVATAGKPRQAGIASKALPAPKPIKRDAPTSAPDASQAKFEKQVLEQIAKYQQRERKQQVASIDTSPALAPYLQDLRGRLKKRLKSSLPTFKGFPGMAVSLTILSDGTLRSIDLDQGSGDPKRDRQVLSSLKQLRHLPQPPPATFEVADVLVVTVMLPIE